MHYFFFIVLILSTSVYADIQGLSDKIQFDVRGDHQIEMTLNTIGLGINTLPSSNLDVSGNGAFSTRLSIGGATSTANLNVQGTVSHVAQIVNSDTVLGSSSYILADSSSDNLILTLPSASSVAGTSFFIKKTSPLNQVWIAASETIENYYTRILLNQQNNLDLPFAQLTSDGSQWYLLNKSTDVETVVAADNLEGWWKLEDASGTTATDTSLNKNHGALVGALTFADNVISDQRDRALVLDGNDDGILITQSSAINAGNNISFCIWLKGGVQSTDYRRVFSKNSTPGWELQVQLAGPSLGLRIDTSAGTNQVKTVNAILDDTWHHYAFTLSNGSVKIYLDGQIALNTTYNHGNGFSNTTDLKIGYGGAYIQGQIDEFRFYSRVLSAEEIDAIYQQTR